MCTLNQKIRLLYRFVQPQYKYQVIRFFNSTLFCNIQSETFIRAFHCTSITYDSKPHKKDEKLEDAHADIELSPNFPEFTKSVLENASSGESEQIDTPNYLSQTNQDYVPRPLVDPKDKTIIMFPGQGAQKVGMGSSLLSCPNVMDMYKTASDIVGYDVLQLCQEGPKEKLDQTRYSQVALLVTSLASLENLRHKNQEVVENCATTMGFSVGEFAALVLAGAITFEEAVQLVHIRGEAMQAASDLVPSGMSTVFLGPDPPIPKILEAACKYALKAGVENPVCVVANNLYPSCKVFAGHLPALEFLENHARHLSVKNGKRLNVSGAFHTPLMEPAMEVWKLALKQVNFKRPVIKVHSNVDGHPHKLKNMSKMLGKHLVSPVKWEQTLTIVFSRLPGTNFPRTYECGPGESMKKILKRVNRKAWDISYSENV